VCEIRTNGQEMDSRCRERKRIDGDKKPVEREKRRIDDKFLSIDGLLFPIDRENFPIIGQKKRNVAEFFHDVAPCYGF